MTKVLGYVLSALALAALQACGGANADSSDAAIGLSESSSESRSAAASVETESARMQALATSRATACATETGSACEAASPIFDTSAAAWKIVTTGNALPGLLGQAQGLVSSLALAVNYRFNCFSSETAECGRVTATYTPATSMQTGRSLVIWFKAPLSADVRAIVCDTAGQCFEYDLKRPANAVATAWTQVVVDTTAPRSRTGSGTLGANARSVSIVSVAAKSGSTSGWIELDAMQFVNPVATVAAAVATAAASAAVAATTPVITVAASSAVVAPPGVIAATPAVAAPAITASPVALAVAAAPTKVAPLVTADSPIVFNATETARPGDIVSIQGFNFGPNPQAWLADSDGDNAQQIKVVNVSGTTSLSAQIPTTASGALILRVLNGSLSSAAVRLNGAVAHHLDTLQLAPGGAFRVFGRNLLVPGAAPIVKVDGALAAVNVGASDENMLIVTAPGSIQATAASVITVDNGNGSGALTLDRKIAVSTGQLGDPFGLSVGWGAGFSTFSSRVIDAASDTRLSTKAVCDGSRDDTYAIQSAIDLMASNAGGVVQLPAGTCRISGVALRSNTVLQGKGKTNTTLRYEGNYPIFGINIDLSGVRNLGVVNAGSVQEGPLLKNSTRVFFQNVLVNMGTSRQMFFTDNTNMVVTGSDFIQTGSINNNGPYLFNGSAGLVFTMNTTSWVNGANAFERTHDSLIAGNTFTRDASNQNADGVVHSLVIGFAHRIAVLGNLFNVKNGPITNVRRNDGETILTEGGGAARTENLGTVQSATANTFADSGNSLNVDPFGLGAIPENYGVAIVSGPGAGQHRRLISYANGVVRVDRNWDVVPTAGSKYATFVWGLEKSLIKANSLSQNPRGIWLYHTAVRDVAVVGNVISEGGGIYMRSYQNLAAKQFMPMYNVRVAGNSVKNTTRNWSSYVSAVFVNSDGQAFGTAMTGIDFRDNQLTANTPNLSSQFEEYAGVDGYMNMTRFEGDGTYQPSTASPRILGTLFQRNVCTNCDIGFRLGTGDSGAVLWSSQLVGSKTLWADWATSSTKETSIGTVVQ